jgi:hypothetical protein
VVERIEMGDTIPLEPVETVEVKEIPLEPVETVKVEEIPYLAPNKDKRFPRR